MSLLPIKSSFILRSSLFPFFSLISAVVRAQIVPQHCFHEALVLSANLACSPTGVGDLMSPIGQYMRPIGVDSYAENSADPSASPWSYKPICTEMLEGIGSILCVYTNITFGGGRGVSIFTTPQIAEKFAALLPFRDDAALDGINGPKGPWYAQKLTDNGIGVLAKRNLDRGDLVMAYTPLLLAHRENALSSRKRERFLRIAVDQLPLASRDLYFNLATAFGDPALIVQDVVNTNAYDIHVGGQVHHAVFPETSRINHGCAPNSQYYLEPSLVTHYVHATRAISVGEEITVSYFNPLHPYLDRQEYLLNYFNFTCSCSRCMSRETSDAVLAQIISLQQDLGDWGPKSTATTEKAEKLIRLYKEDGLDSFLNLAYGHAAVAYSAVGNAKRAKKYAGLAAEAVALKDGPGAADVKMWNEMKDNPKEHWSWRRRRH